MIHNLIWSTALGLTIQSAQGLTINVAQASYDINQQPVVGIVSQPLDASMSNDPRFAGYSTYIQASYVQFVESAGARVVPLTPAETWTATVSKLGKLNGVFFPGGSGNYIEFGRKIFNQVKTYNSSGKFYPLWGTNEGFQNMAIWASSTGNVLSVLSADGCLPLEFQVDPITTKMFSDLGTDAYKFKDQAIAHNAHAQGISPDVFSSDAGLKAMFQATSVSYTTDALHQPFVTTMESYVYPFFGTQFNTEKVETSHRSWDAVRLNRSLAADKFVKLARQNTNYYGSYTTVQKVIIESNLSIVTDGPYGQVYVFI